MCKVAGIGGEGRQAVDSPSFPHEGGEMVQAKRELLHGGGHETYSVWGESGGERPQSFLLQGKHM